MIRLSRKAQAQVSSLASYYEDLDRPEAVRNLRAAIVKAGEYIFMSKHRILRQDIRLAPSIGQQPDHEFNRHPRPRITGFPANTLGSSVMEDCSAVMGRRLLSALPI